MQFPCPSRSLLAILLLTSTAQATPVSINVNAANATGPFIPLANFFGTDEPNYAYFPDGKKLLGEMGKLGSAQSYFRTHNLLTTGDGTPAPKWGSTNAYTEDAQGNPIYNWTILDRIFDAYLDNNVKPYAQVGFMPEALSTHPLPYRFNFTPTDNSDVIYTGWSNPPTSYGKWGELVYQWVKHCVDRYGASEVESWYWEVWNEPNIKYWNGTVDQFFQLHDYAIANVRRALPTARVGGFETAGGPGGDYLGNFIEHVLHGTNYATGKIGSPLDFLSFHAKGSPVFINSSCHVGGGYIRMDLAPQLQNVNDSFALFASYPQIKDKPIVMSEYDPDSCGACLTPQYGYRNGLLYPSYNAASFVRALDLAERYGVNLQGAVTWAFEYDGYPYFDGSRVLTTRGIDKPVINFPRMLGKMSGQRLDATSSGQVPLDEALTSSIQGAPDVGVLSSLDRGRLSVFVWHYHDDQLPKPDANINVSVEGLPWSGRGKLTHYRIDDNHSNSYALWLKYGSPQNVTTEQYAALKAAGQLATLGEPQDVQVANTGAANMTFSLPIHSLTLLVLEQDV